MGSQVNNLSFAVIAERASRVPGVWVAARRGQATANLVTRIRQDQVAHLPAECYEAVSTRTTVDGRVSYDIDVRLTVPHVEDPDAPGAVTANAISRAIARRWSAYRHLSHAAQRELRTIIEETMR